MPIKTTDQEIGARPLTPIFFLVDTSGSMVNDPIEAVNAAMRQAIPEIKNFAQENADSSILVSVVLKTQVEDLFPIGLILTSDLQ